MPPWSPPSPGPTAGCSASAGERHPKSRCTRRIPSEAKPDGEADKAHWAYELSMIVSGSDDPSRPQTFPSLAMGMAILHKPSHNPGGQAVRALASVRERGHPARLLAGDRAYSCLLYTSDAAA